MLPLLLLLLFSHTTYADSSISMQEAFSVPTKDSLTWAEGSRQTVIFSTTLNSWNLTLHQILVNGTIISAPDVISSQTNGEGRGNVIHMLNEPWTVQTYNLNLDDSKTFFLGLNSSSAASFEGCKSSAFTISRQSTSTPTPAPQGAYKMPPKAIALACGIGIPILILLGVLIGMLLMRRRRSSLGRKEAPAKTGPTPRASADSLSVYSFDDYWTYRGSVKPLPPLPRNQTEGAKGPFELSVEPKTPNEEIEAMVGDGRGGMVGLGIV
jgi:hypothetical protein